MLIYYILMQKLEENIQELNINMGLDNREKNEEEPTIEELIEACTDVLEQDVLEDLRSMEFDDAIGYIFTLLLDVVEAPEEFLKKKGVLE